LQVTPVNQVPEAVATHGIRGQNTRGQIYRLYGRLVSCSSSPPLIPSFTLHPAIYVGACLPVGHARCTYVLYRCIARIRITPTIPDNSARSSTLAMFIGNTEFNDERTHFEIRFNLSIDTFIASQSNDLVHAIIISHASLSPQHRFSHFRSSSEILCLNVV